MAIDRFRQGHVSAKLEMRHERPPGADDPHELRTSCQCVSQSLPHLERELRHKPCPPIPTSRQQSAHISRAVVMSQSCRPGVQQRVHHVLALLILQALHVHGLRAPAPVRKSASLQGKLESFEENVAQFATGAGTVIVDGDNVRGKSGFAVSHMELVRAASLWGNQRGLEGRLVVCIDHGSAADAWYLSELGLAVCFAGPVGTADDLIARAVPCFANAIVITADAGLAKRCRSAARGRLQVIAPQPFLASLAQACAASDEARSPEIGELGGGELLLSEALGLLRPPPARGGLLQAPTADVAEGEGEMSGEMSDEMSGEMPARSLLALEAEMDARAALIKAERRLSKLAGR